MNLFYSTEVINCKTDQYDVYIGRPSIWGNPFVIRKDGNRKEVIFKYRKWLKDQLKTGNIKIEELKNLKNKKLGCWCKPKPCHGDVILDFLDKL